MDRKNIAWVLHFDGLFHLVAGLALPLLAPALLNAASWRGQDLWLYLQLLSSALILLALAGLLAAYQPAGSRDTILAGVVAKLLISGLGLYALAFGGLSLTFPAALLGMVAIQLALAGLETAFLTASTGAFPANLHLEGNR